MPATSHRPTWDERIARARDLAAARPAAHELLTFYAALAEYQKALAERVATGEPFHVERVLDAIPDFLSWLGRAALSRLSDAARVQRGWRSDPPRARCR